MKLIKRLLTSLILLGLIGCNGEKEDINLSQYVSPLRNVPIPIEDETPWTQDIELNPILQDSIITLEEQEELIKMIEDLLKELAYFKREYYLLKLKK